MNLSGTLLTLVRDVRLNLDDNTPSEYRWSDEEIVKALNNAEMEIARRTHCLEDTLDIELTESTATYSLENNVLFVKSAKITDDNKTVDKKTIDWLNEFMPNWETDIGIPSYFIEESNSITLTPVPSVDCEGKTLRLKIVRLPENLLSESNTTPEIHYKHYNDMVLYACHLLKLKKDSDTFDYEGAMVDYELFSNSVGKRPDANVERLMKESPFYTKITLRR